MQRNILEYLEHAHHDCHRPAVIDNGKRYTFQELERYAWTCGSLLAQKCDLMGRPIAVYLPKSAEVIFADLGIVYSGNCYMNLDVKNPAQRVKAILENIEPVFIITSSALAGNLLQIGVPPERILFIEEILRAPLIESSDALWRRLENMIDTDPLCIINTSGSTGVPKGVVLNHRSTIDFMDWCFDRLKLDGNHRIGSLSPFYFDIYTLELNLCLAKGATIVIIPESLAAFPAKLMSFISSSAISFVFWVPTIMVNIAEQGLLDAFDLSSLREVLFAGEVFPTKHLNRWRRTLHNARFINLYGPIEITVDCTYFIVERKMDDDEALPIGFPCRNSDVLILNDQNNIAQIDERGELCVRGTSLAMGYWNDAEKTAKAFVQNPLNQNYPELIYRTGDLVYRNDRNEIMYVGRKDYQVKHLGYRIELLEIEHQVLSIPEISNACVLYNKEQRVITLCYESPAYDVSDASIRTGLSKTLPKYMLPTVFVRMSELPRNPNGKIDRNGLQKRMQNASYALTAKH